MYKNVQSSLTHSSQKVETIQPSINQLIYKQNVYPYKEYYPSINSSGVHA